VNILSPNQKAIRRLLRNRSAVFGLIVITIATFIALFAYFLAPDHTPNANNQILELANQPPGFKVQLLQQIKPTPTQTTNIFAQLLNGAETPYKSIPISSYQFSNQQLIIQKYTNNNQTTTTDTLLLPAVLYNLADSANVQVSNNQISFITNNGTTQTANITDLQNQISQRIVQKTYWLGTDKFGRDNLSRLILGVRISLSVGLMAVLIALLIGVTLGAIAGYFGGWIDDVIMWIISVFWPIPLLLLVFALVLAMGRDFWQIYLAVGLTMWVEVARMVRGQVLSMRQKEFVEAAYSLGVGHTQIIFKHILPNIMGPIVVVAASDFASAIIIEAGLSFLGIGVQPPTPSWGSMLNEYYGYIGTSKAFLALIPGFAIMLLVLAFNLLGNGLRDALDVKGNLIKS
jgi:peptide/nickel transport system permease protein